MEHIVTDPFLLEVGRAVDRAVLDHSPEIELLRPQRRVVAALSALRSCGFVKRKHEGEQHTIWQPSELAVKMMKLDDYGLSRRKRKVALTPQFYFVMHVPIDWTSRDDELSNHYARLMRKAIVHGFWRDIGTIVGELGSHRLRLVGPEMTQGFIFEELTEWSEFADSSEIHFTLTPDSAQTDREPIAIADYARASGVDLIFEWPLRFDSRRDSPDRSISRNGLQVD